MESNQLNKLLIFNFPLLLDKYEEETSWQEGDYTGSHTVYGDVFVPYIVSCIKNNQVDKLKDIFNFIEDLLNLNDEYAENVAVVSVLESVTYLKNEIEIFLGKKSKEIIETF